MTKDADFAVAVERPRVLNKEEILACTDRKALLGMQWDYEDCVTEIEIMLQYPDEPRDPDWCAEREAR